MSRRARLWALALAVLATGAMADSRAAYDARIAKAGALCIMLSGRIDLGFGRGPETLDSLAAETGVDRAVIGGWAEARAAEHAIALEVLRAGGEPLRDPPEPFLSHLRQTQADCQDLELRRRQLEARAARGPFPDPGPAAPVLTPALDPERDPDLTQRLRMTIHFADAAMAAGAEEPLRRLLEVMVGAPVDMDAVLAVEGWDEAQALARVLLTPEPRVTEDFFDGDHRIVMGRLMADPDGPFAAYYARLTVLNLEAAGQIDPALRADDPDDRELIRRTFDRAFTDCRLIGQTGLLWCPGTAE